jgi:hypothetical protein
MAPKVERSEEAGSDRHRDVSVLLIHLLVNRGLEPAVEPDRIIVAPRAREFAAPDHLT